jgi:SAM-dependent methyltransferase
MRLPRRRRTPSETKLHIGAFDLVHDGWLNTDVTAHIAVARVPGLARVLHRLGLLSAERLAAHRSGTFRRLHYLDLASALPYPDGAFEAIFGAHVLEHLTPDEADTLLRECRRVLRPGGVLRVSVPDLDYEVSSYDPDRADDFVFRLWGERRDRSASRHRHWWLYNERSLGTRLAAAGFAEVERRGFREGRLPDVERVDVRPGSVFMEAIRP